MKKFAWILGLGLSAAAQAGDFTCVNFRGYYPMGGTMQGLDFKDLGEGNYDLTLSSADNGRHPIEVRRLGTFNCVVDPTELALFVCNQKFAGSDDKINSVEGTIANVTYLNGKGKRVTQNAPKLQIILVKSLTAPEVIEFGMMLSGLSELQNERCFANETFEIVEEREARLR